MDLSLQAMNIEPMFVIFQLVPCLHMKFANIEVVDKLQIQKKKHLVKRQLH